MARPLTDHDKKRLEIARATCRVIKRQGLHRTKLRDIAGELGATTGTLQHYFKTKEELLRLAKDTLVDASLSDAVSGAEALTGLDRLQAMCERMVPLDQARMDMWLIVISYLGQAIGDDVTMGSLVARYRRSQDIFAAEIRSLQRAGQIAEDADADLEAFSLLAFLEGLALQVVFTPERFERPYQRRMIARYLKHALGRPLEASPAGARMETVSG